VLYLLDANVLITANSAYYPIDQVPEFWGWMHHQASSDQIKIPREILEEIRAGRKDDDQLLDWISSPEIETALLLDEVVDAARFNKWSLKDTRRTSAMLRLRKLAGIRS